VRNPRERASGAIVVVGRLSRVLDGVRLFRLVFGGWFERGFDGKSLREW
jgi:hypothetical protein